MSSRNPVPLVIISLEDDEDDASFSDENGEYHQDQEPEYFPNMHPGSCTPSQPSQSHPEQNAAQTTPPLRKSASHLNETTPKRHQSPQKPKSPLVSTFKRPPLKTRPHSLKQQSSKLKGTQDKSQQAKGVKVPPTSRTKLSNMDHPLGKQPITPGRNAGKQSTMGRKTNATTNNQLEEDAEDRKMLQIIQSLKPPMVHKPKRKDDALFCDRLEEELVVLTTAVEKGTGIGRALFSRDLPRGGSDKAHLDRPRFGASPKAYGNVRPDSSRSPQFSGYATRYGSLLDLKNDSVPPTDRLQVPQAMASVVNSTSHQITSQEYLLGSADVREDIFSLSPGTSHKSKIPGLKNTKSGSSPSISADSPLRSPTMSPTFALSPQISSPPYAPEHIPKALSPAHPRDNHTKIPDSDNIHSSNTIIPSTNSKSNSAGATNNSAVSKNGGNNNSNINSTNKRNPNKNSTNKINNPTKSTDSNKNSDSSKVASNNHNENISSDTSSSDSDSDNGNGSEGGDLASLDIAQLKEMERMLKQKEEALLALQTQLRQRETQVFVLEEQTIELLENEDKRLKDKELELRHWEKLLRREVKRRLGDPSDAPPELKDMDTMDDSSSVFSESMQSDMTEEETRSESSNTSGNSKKSKKKKRNRKVSSKDKEHCSIS